MFGLNSLLDLIVWTFVNVTRPFLSEYYGSVDYNEASKVSYLNFVVVCYSDRGDACTCCCYRVLE